MATDARNHVIPAAAGKPERADFDRLSLSINDIVPVANATARAAKVTELTAAGTPPTTSRPLLVWRADAGIGRELEVTTGSGFATYQSGSGMNADISIAVLAGTLDPAKTVWSADWGVGVATNAQGDGLIAIPPGFGTVTCILGITVQGRGSAAFPINAHIFTTLGTSTTQVAVRLYNGTTPAASTTVACGVSMRYQR